MAPSRSFDEQEEEISAAIGRVLKSGMWVYGPEGRALEEELADFLDTENASVTGSGTDSLWMSLEALGVKAGDEIITPAYSFFASASVIRHLGARPVFCDADERTFNLDPSAVEAAITPKTVGIIPVHLYGLPADMTRLVDIAEKHGIFLLEDACQAIGATVNDRKVGGIGELAAFSFYPTKNLAACGEGGAVTGRDSDKVELVGKLRLHGETERYHHSLLGRNSRMDEIQAAILRVRLKKLQEWTTRRQEIASMYTDAWADLPLRVPYVPDGFSHVYHLYVIQSRDRDRLREFLSERGISSGLYYPIPLPYLEIFQDLGHRPGDFPASDRLSREVAALPIFPHMTDEEIERVVDALLTFHGYGG